jgi:hypothetical protein
MDNKRKKDLVREYRERKPETGIYAVRCKPSGEVWVAASRDLEKQQNGLWFQLRIGNFPNPELLTAWKKHGEDAFTFEIIEQVRDDNPQLIGVLLKERDLHWRKQLNANRVAG